MKKDRIKSISFTPGQLLRRKTIIFSIVENFADQLVIQHVITSEKKYISKSKFYEEYRNGDLVLCTEQEIRKLQNGYLFDDEKNDSTDIPLNGLSDAAKSMGLRKLKYIRALREQGFQCLRPTSLLKMAFNRLKLEAHDNSPLSIDTLYKSSIKLDKNNGDSRVVFPNFADRGGRKQIRLLPEAKSAINEVIKELRTNTDNKIRFVDIEDAIKIKIAMGNPSHDPLQFMPSRSSIERIFKAEFGQYEIHCRNFGKKRADKKFADWYPRDRALCPLEVVEFDDKDSRVFLINERTGLPSGRAYITSGVDQYSAVPLGLSISSKHRDRWSAINAYSNSILPKDNSSIDFGTTKSEAEFFGVMGICIFDNALYFHARDLETTIIECSNSIIGWAKPYTPREKSVVEDFNGRLTKGILSELPGFGGAKDSRDGLKSGLANAAMSETEFRQKIYQWTYDVYCNQPRANGYSPRQMWHMAMRNSSPRVPADLSQFKAAIGLSHKVRFRTEGINFGGLIYQNPRLMQLRLFLGATAYISFRYNPERLTTIFVLDPTSKKYFEVKTAMPEYVNNLNLYQHCLIVKMAKENKKKNPILMELLFFKEKLKKMTAQTMYSKKLRDRKNAQRAYVDDGNDLFPSTTTVESSESVSEIEYLVDQLTQVEMEEGDDSWQLDEGFDVN